ncbi:hypothetical protein EVA_16995 [gut metagenome]|uniref:Uncharacterized protein n=1 Tax=gut metagenome TaxID=749906 RepID=J9FZB9_9ZZZZ
MLEAPGVALRVEGAGRALGARPPWRGGEGADGLGVHQPLAGLGEAHPEPPHHEVDRSAPRPAGEAAEGVGARVERQARVVVVVEGAEALVALDAEPHPLRHLLDGQVAEPLEGEGVDHRAGRCWRVEGSSARYSGVLV